MVQSFTKKSKAQAAKTAHICTKHRVVKYVPGGPDHLVWVYGRTGSGQRLRRHPASARPGVVVRN
jgi:hypothetical protein